MDLIFHDEPMQKITTAELAVVEALADDGDMFAQRILGDLFDDGSEADKAMACQWYHRAACHGCRFSQYKLGIMYLEGLGVGENNRKALLWLMRARHEHVDDGLPERRQCCPMCFSHIMLDGMRLTTTETQSVIQLALAMMCERGLEIRAAYAPHNGYYCSANIYLNTMNNILN